MSEHPGGIATPSKFVWSDDFSYERYVNLGYEYLKLPSITALLSVCEVATNSRDSKLLVDLGPRLRRELETNNPNIYIVLYALKIASLNLPSFPFDIRKCLAILKLRNTEFHTAARKEAAHLLEHFNRHTSLETFPGLDVKSERRTSELATVTELVHEISTEISEAAGELTGTFTTGEASYSTDPAVALTSFFCHLRTSIRSKGLQWWDPAAAHSYDMTKLESTLLEAVRNKRPYSLIRLGDGEGLFLTGRRADIGGATRNGRVEEDDLLNPDGAVTPIAYERLIIRFQHAIRNADIVGIPDIEQCLFGPKDLQTVPIGLSNFLTPGDLHQMRDQIVVGGWHLHLYLLCSRLFENRELLSSISGVVGPIVPQALRRLEAGSFLVPGEHGFWQNSKDTPSHFPAFFLRFDEWALRNVQHGRTYLVGAGILGKIYCDTIKSHGGIALDVGSLADFFANRHNTRGEFRKSPYLKHYVDDSLKAMAAIP